MSKLNKDDFDRFLGNESFYSDTDRERFFKKKNKKRVWFPQALTAAVAIGVLLFTFQIATENMPLFLKNNDKPVPTQPDSQSHEIYEVDSLDEVEEFYAKKTPGLKRAEELGLVEEVDRTIPLTEDTDLHIDKIWYNSDEIFYFYSISLPDPDIIKENGRGPTISKVKVKPDSTGQFSKQTLDVYTKNMPAPVGVIYNDRFYHRATTLPIRTESNDTLGSINSTIKTNITVSLFEEEITAPTINIPFRFDESAEPMISNEVAKSMNKHNVTINFNEFISGVTRNQLLGTATTPNRDLVTEMKGTIQTSDGEEFTLFGGGKVEGNPQEVGFYNISPFNTEPDEVTVTIDTISLIGNDLSFDFSLDVSDYQEKLSNTNSYEKQIHKKLGTILDTDIYLEKLYYVESGIDFTILYEPKDPEQEIQLQATTPSTLFESQMDDEKLRKSLRTFVEAENEKGEPAIYGQRGRGPEETFSLFLEKEFVESSETIHVSVKNLVYKIRMNESLSFPLSYSLSY